MQKITYFDFLEITEDEKALKALLHQTKEEPSFTPKRETIDNLLNYSKALSIRKSENLEFIQLVLN